MKTKRKFVHTSGVLALVGEALIFDGSGDIVFRSKGTLCGRGGKGDLEVVAMFDLFKSFRAPKSSGVLGKNRRMPIVSDGERSAMSAKLLYYVLVTFLFHGKLFIYLCVQKSRYNNVIFKFSRKKTKALLSSFKALREE